MSTLSLHRRIVASSKLVHHLDAVDIRCAALEILHLFPQYMNDSMLVSVKKVVNAVVTQEHTQVLASLIRLISSVLQS